MTNTKEKCYALKWTLENQVIFVIQCIYVTVTMLSCCTKDETFHENAKNNGNLIICPKNVLATWEMEIKKWFPFATVLYYYYI